MDVSEVGEPFTRALTIVKQVRKITSRGRMDDQDVQAVFDAADEIERLIGVILTYSRQYER